ncbi:MAG TPA: SRPBCC family protein [Jatrophihabitantaceae bacterium]|jgi:carbon monoxide dehydrogenase subunit G|nr:SRPBCC family protein [Jatrophihabitantaceae bacterium]
MKRYECDRVDDSFIDTAPIRYVNSVVIDATPDAIWSALEDASAWPRWASVIKKVEWTSPPPFGLGTTRTVTMTGRMCGYEEFIAWDPGRRMSFRFNAASMNGVSAFAERYTLEPTNPGQTRVTWVMAMSPKGVSKLIVPLGRRGMELLFGRMLRTFKTIVEAEYATAPSG